MSRYAVILACLPLLQLAGCGQDAPQHPRTNAQPALHVATARPWGNGDTVVLARLALHREYAQERTDRRDWRRHWFLTKFQVLRVERGTWAEPEISLVTDYAWPTVESGIVLEAGLDGRIPPTYVAAIWALHLTTATKPATVVGYERRSLVPPHEKPPADLDVEPGDPKVPGLRRAILPDGVLASVNAFMAAMGKRPGSDFHYQGTEQTATAYVLQTLSSPDADGHQSVWTLEVPKATRETRLLWSVP